MRKNTYFYLGRDIDTREKRFKTNYCVRPTTSLEKLLLPTINLIRSLTGLWGEGWDEGCDLRLRVLSCLCNIFHNAAEFFR